MRQRLVERFGGYSEDTLGQGQAFVPVIGLDMPGMVPGMAGVAPLGQIAVVSNSSQVGQLSHTPDTHKHAHAHPFLPVDSIALSCNDLSMNSTCTGSLQGVSHSLKIGAVDVHSNHF